MKCEHNALHSILSSNWYGVYHIFFALVVAVLRFVVKRGTATLGKEKTKPKSQHGDNRKLLEEIAELITTYDEVRKVCARRNVGIKRLVLSAIRLWDKEYDIRAASTEGLPTVDGKRMSMEEARTLYGDLSRYFSKLRMMATPVAIRKKNAKDGAKTRWNRPDK